MLMLAKLAFRLRPPLRIIPSRSYGSPSFLQNKYLARPYYWWLRARNRPDGTRRSILRGILHGAFYVSVAVYAYRQYKPIKDSKVLITELSRIVELQRINRKYRASTFTEPAEIKAYITDIAKVEFMPGASEIFSHFCEEYETLVKNVPEEQEKVRESICSLREILATGCSSKESPLTGVAREVRKAWEQLLLETLATLIKSSLKEAEQVMEQLNQIGRQ